MYEKKKLPIGYVNTWEILPIGTPIMIRTLEGDIDLTVEEDLVVMIGIKGEVYPNRLEKFKRSYNLSEEEYSYNTMTATEYVPTVKVKSTGVTLKLIDYARSKGAEVAICTLVPIDSQKFMNWVSRGLNYENILNWLGDVDRISRWQEYYSKLSEKVAKIAHCKILDLRSIFKGSMDNFIGIDGMHPSAEGHTKIREAFQQKILSNAFVPAV